MTDPIVLRVDNELADQIVIAWLKQHMKWTLEAFEMSSNEEDRLEYTADHLSMKRIYYYVSGEIENYGEEAISSTP
jgi:hypothetical protein